VRGDGGGVVLWGWRGGGCEGWGLDDSKPPLEALL